MISAMSVFPASLSGKGLAKTLYNLDSDAVEGAYTQRSKRGYSRPVNNKLVLGFWHFFPISIDNKVLAEDYYTTQFIRADGEKGKHSAYGGFLRDRPLPICPIQRVDWEIAIATLDIKFAIDSGINAFLFNIDSLRENLGYVRRANTLYDAIEKSNFDFKMAPCIDIDTFKNVYSVDDIVEVLRPMLSRRGALLIDGRPLLASFAADLWTADRWKATLRALEVAGIQAYFLPIFLDPARTTAEHIEIADMIGWWTGNYLESVAQVRKRADIARDANKAVMWSVWPQDCRPKAQWFAEARNSETFRTSWQEAIAFNPECVCLITWNDYSETSQIRPSIGTQFAFSDLNRFYVDWYRAGAMPDIEQDTLFYFHRRDFTDASRGLIPGRPAMRMRFGSAPVDDVEVVALLSSPGAVHIRNQYGNCEFSAGKGLASFRTKLAPGVQSFKLSRGRSDVISMSSQTVVRSSWDWQDMGYRGGGSNRLPWRGHIDC